MSPLIMLIGTFTPVSSDPRVENGSGRKERAKMGNTKRKWTSDGRITKSQGQLKEDAGLYAEGEGGWCSGGGGGGGGGGSVEPF